jgi:hypothetical protein
VLDDDSTLNTFFQARSAMRRFHVENMRLVCHGMVKAGLGNSEQRILQVMSGLESRVLTQSSLQAFSFAIWIRAASASQPASSIKFRKIQGLHRFD